MQPAPAHLERLVAVRDDQPPVVVAHQVARVRAGRVGAQARHRVGPRLEPHLPGGGRLLLLLAARSRAGCWRVQRLDAGILARRAVPLGDALEHGAAAGPTPGLSAQRVLTGHGAARAARGGVRRVQIGCSEPSIRFRRLRCRKVASSRVLAVVLAVVS
jgi:hypothetical protein